MPAITVEDVLVLPRIPDPDPATATERRATSITFWPPTSLATRIATMLKEWAKAPESVTAP